MILSVTEEEVKTKGFYIDDELKEAIKKVWADPVIQEVFLMSTEVNLPDNMD